MPESPFRYLRRSPSNVKTGYRLLDLLAVPVVVALDGFDSSARQNAIVGWTMAGIVALAGAENLLTNAFLWAGFSLLVVVVASLPALATRDWTAIVPWPLLSVAAIATTAQVVGLYTETAGYLTIATLAVIVVVELDVFTPVDLSRWFAVGFAVLMTMAIEAIWIVAQFYSDQWFGTDFLRSQIELQRDIVIVTVVGFVVGGFFYWYLARFGPVGPDVGSSSGGTS